MASALQGSVADWVGRVTGNSHEGNYLDLVGKTYASVTRTTPKTIYDPTTGKIHDVRAGYLAVNPWGAYQPGGHGVAPVIEEARTNYLVNSYGAANNGSKWLDWSIGGTTTVPAEYTIVPGVYSSTAQHVRYSGVPDDAPAKVLQYYRTSVNGSFSAGDSATVSVWAKAAPSDAVRTFNIVAKALDNTTLGTVALDSTTRMTDSWSRLVVTYSTLPTGTDHVSCYMGTTVYPTTVLDDVYDAWQCEKGAFATSYIPTTTTAVTRNADVVTVPTAGWNVAAGTILVICGRRTPSVTDNTLPIYWGNADMSTYIAVQHTGTGMRGVVKSAGAAYLSSTIVDAAAPAVKAVAWSSTVTGYLNGMPSSSASIAVSPSGMLSTASLCSPYLVSQINGPHQRIAVYASRLTAAQVAALNPLIRGERPSNVRRCVLLGV